MEFKRNLSKIIKISTSHRSNFIILAVDSLIRFLSTIYFYNSTQLNNIAYVYSTLAAAMIFAASLGLTIIPTTVRSAENSLRKPTRLILRGQFTFIFIILLLGYMISSAVDSKYGIDKYAEYCAIGAGLALFGMVNAVQRNIGKIKQMISSRLILSVLYAILCIIASEVELTKVQLFNLLFFHLFILILAFGIILDLFILRKNSIRKLFKVIKFFYYNAVKYLNFIIAAIFFTYFINIDRVLIANEFNSFEIQEYAQATAFLSISIVLYNYYISNIYVQIVSRAKNDSITQSVVFLTSFMLISICVSVLIFYFFKIISGNNSKLFPEGTLSSISIHYFTYALGCYVFTFSKVNNLMLMLKIMVMLTIYAMTQIPIGINSLDIILIIDILVISFAVIILCNENGNKSRKIN
jgi:hypothetical protein